MAAIPRGSPYRTDHERSTHRADRSRMPKTLGALLDWFAREWEAEIPDKLHTVEVWNGRQRYRTVPVTKPDGTPVLTEDGRPKKRVEAVWPEALVGGSALGSHADTSLFRRYMEDYGAERDQDGYYVRPTHAALGRLARRDHWMARNIFAVAQAGYDWRGVADRGKWVHGMYRVYIEEALRRLWLEFSDVEVRLQ